MTGELKQFLADHGSDLLHWRHETVVIESYLSKQFKALGGDMDLLIACFEDNCEIEGAASDYFLSKTEATP